MKEFLKSGAAIATALVVGFMVALILVASSFSDKLDAERFVGYRCAVAYNPADYANKKAVLVTDDEKVCIKLHCKVFPDSDVCKRKWKK